VSLAPHRRLQLAIAVPSVMALALLTFAAPATGSAGAPGSAGTDTSLPATDSQVTVSGRGPFADLEITINQTRNLVNQAVSLTWTGGRPTIEGPGRFGGNYLQILQCWGDDDGTNPANPGPPPEQCVQGAVGGVYGGLPGGVYPGGFTISRVINRTGWPNHDPAVGVADPRTTNVWRPFRAVDGTVIDVHTDPDFNPSVLGGNFWLNPYFNVVTTNEIAGAVTSEEGTGSELFTIDTGVESSGLGCGQRVEPLAGGGFREPQCWLVIVPRGTPEEENVGTPFEENASQFGVVTSPLAPTAWEHRIAVPLGFNPVDSACSINAADRRMTGSELFVSALANWQPSLCASGDRPPYVFGTVSDALARQQLLSGAAGAAGMAVTPRPVDPAEVPPSSPVLYAPMTLSGVVIGFNVERNVRPEAPEEAQALAGVRVADINLTPRLVAKLLTQSYSSQVNIIGDPGYLWVADNPAHLGLDRDFLQFNPEFELLQVAAAKNFGGLLLPSINSDVARQVWQWILADPEAKAWLDGQPDPWGMRVNPVYATTTAANPSGFPFADPVPDTFPKSDPYCYQAPPQGIGGAVVPPPLCGTDWLPFAQSMGDASRLTRLADDRAKVVNDVFALTPDQVWKRDLPQFIGRRAILALTDSASAARYGLQTARLSRAGDNGPDRTFAGPDVTGLLGGLGGFRAGSEPAVLEPEPTATPTGGYPLTALTYAAIRPLELDAAARDDYAALVEYAVGPGQVPGVAPGRLPLGYAPIPDALRTQALETAQAIRQLQPTPAPEQPITVPDPAAPTSPVASATVASAPVTTVAPPVEEVAAVAVVDETESTDSGLLTPVLALAGSRFFVPVLGAVALLAALGAIEITKRPRRAVAKGVS
jgi:hypothetical protein